MGSRFMVNGIMNQWQEVLVLLLVIIILNFHINPIKQQQNIILYIININNHNNSNLDIYNHFNKKKWNIERKGELKRGIMVNLERKIKFIMKDNNMKLLWC